MYSFVCASCLFTFVASILQKQVNWHFHVEIFGDFSGIRVLLFICYLPYRVGYILNVTKEIDNFYPGTFDYLNIRVYDDEKTELLKHWDRTFRYIAQVK